MAVSAHFFEIALKPNHPYTTFPSSGPKMGNYMAQQTEPSLYYVSIEWSENGKLYGPTNRTIPILRFRRMVYRMVFIFCAHIGKLYDPKKFLSFNPKMENYMIPQIKVRLNLHINSTLMSPCSITSSISGFPTLLKIDEY